MSLLDYAHNPDLHPCPLPPISLRNSGRDWPVALLAEPLAANLIAAGLTADTRGKLLDADGSILDPLALAERVADLLVDAADRLTSAASAAGYHPWTSYAPPPATPAYRFHDESESLRASARVLRTSTPAARVFAQRLRPRLPPPAAPRDALEAFLTMFDPAEVVDRADLGRAYVAAASPGGLSRTALYALAADRWGPVVKLDGGARCFRPTARSVAAGAPGASLEQALAALNALYGVDTVATAQESVSGYRERVLDLLQRRRYARALNLHRDRHLGERDHRKEA